MSASRRWLILIATSIVSFMATLDASIVNIALPYIARELKVPMSTVELVTSVYMIAICVLLIFWGSCLTAWVGSGCFSWGPFCLH